MKFSSIAFVAALSIGLAGCSAGTQNPSDQPSREYIATDSVVKIDSTAKACGLIEHGSGFIIGDGLVMTNAHVVAATSQLDIIAAGSTYSGKVVYFDPKFDLAIVKVDGLSIPALSFGEALADKDAVTADGYPLGASFKSLAATKVRTVTWKAHDIYGQDAFEQKLYELSATIEHGNSGGPILDADNAVRGVVLGKASNTKAYAIPVSTATDALAAFQKAGETKIANTKCVPSN